MLLQFSFKPVGTFMTVAPWHIAVLIPARNEEALLPRCLQSVLDACQQLPLSTTWDVIVSVDSSTDLTGNIAERILARHGAVVTTQAQSVGEARRLAARKALDRYLDPLSRCWLANTDADCCVPKSWLIDHLIVAASGQDAVAGIIDIDSFESHSAEVEQRFRANYQIHEDGTHPHVHGANLGIRADAYLRAGGWSDLETAEDHDLWNRLITTGSRRQSNARMRVMTSGRRTGRAPHGFAQALGAHNEVLIGR
jgi:glycosyltransferase involved in cell wall biosynthesis